MFKEPCQVEPPAYAAGARLLQTMINHKRMPTHFSSIDPSDLESLNVLYEAWSALSDDNFCSWYRAVSAQ